MDAPSEVMDVDRVVRLLADPDCVTNVASSGRNSHLSAFLLMTKKILPGSVAVTAHSPNRGWRNSKASSGGMPKPFRATTMTPSRTPPTPEVGSMEMSRTVGTTMNQSDRTP